MKVAILGTGISGVTLALRLQQAGIDSTLFADRSPSEIRDGRLLNTVARFGHTLERERALGIDHWAGAGHAFDCCHLSVGAPLDVAFVGRAAGGVEAVDFRLLLPRWIEDYAGRGGRVVDARPSDVPSLERAVHGHDLVVAAVGRSSLSTLFPVDPARSPYGEPQRLLLAALVDGLALPEPAGLSFNVAPGAGELFQMPIFTAAGLGTNILIEAIPHGPLAEVVTRPVDDPAFGDAVCDALAAFAPAIAARVDRSAFRIRSSRDVLQGAITPAVRHAFARLSGGTPALAIGDAWVTNDPITGQGANIGSHCAFVAADAIARGGPYDEEWGAAAEAAMWEFAGPVTAWTNAFLQPPPPHVVQLLHAASEHQAVADALISGFGTPVTLAAALADPDATTAFIKTAASRLEPVA
jgi:hypothetical protein